jgi:hypothetical protein
VNYSNAICGSPARPNPSKGAPLRGRTVSWRSSSIAVEAFDSWLDASVTVKTVFVPTVKTVFVRVRSSPLVPARTKTHQGGMPLERTPATPGDSGAHRPAAYGNRSVDSPLPCLRGCTSEGEDSMDMLSVLLLPDPGPGDHGWRTGEKAGAEDRLPAMGRTEVPHEIAALRSLPAALNSSPAPMPMHGRIREDLRRNKRGKWGGAPADGAVGAGQAQALAAMQPSQLAVVLQGLPIANILMVRAVTPPPQAVLVVALLALLPGSFSPRMPRTPNPLLWGFLCLARRHMAAPVLSSPIYAPTPPAGPGSVTHFPGCVPLHFPLGPERNRHQVEWRQYCTESLSDLRLPAYAGGHACRAEHENAPAQGSGG